MSNNAPNALSGKVLPELAQQINALHTQSEAALRYGLMRAREAGQLLIQAKEQCLHGAWQPWLAAHVQFSERTAQAYMRIARRWEEIEAKAQGLADLTFEGGLQLLAAPKENSDPDGVQEIPIALIRIGNRYRKDLGNLKELADSVRDVGLLQAITVTPDNLLVVGRRRLEAVRLLGWETIPAYIRDIDPVRAEMCENSFRKAYSPSELAALDEEIAEAGRVAGSET